ncbi:hypothetical protein BN1183_CO_00030 [Pantoea ananatis]|nr:hypothetical protein BN1183_CO_00030 [Pantoea ananatis]
MPELTVVSAGGSPARNNPSARHLPGFLRLLRECMSMLHENA